jgi:hypothetical protein
MKELKTLVEAEIFQDDKYTQAMYYTKEFYELVRKECLEGKGIVAFE